MNIIFIGVKWDLMLLIVGIWMLVGIGLFIGTATYGFNHNITGMVVCTVLSVLWAYICRTALDNGVVGEPATTRGERL